MSQTSERAEPSELVEQIWCGWNKFGVGGANLEWVEWMWAEQCGLEETMATSQGWIQKF